MAMELWSPGRVNFLLDVPGPVLPPKVPKSFSFNQDRPMGGSMEGYLPSRLDFPSVAGIVLTLER